MKNSLNLIFVALLLIVLGCSCPNKLKELSSKKSETPISVSTPTTDSPSFPANSSGSANQTQKNRVSSLSLADYNRVKNGINYAEAVNILGSEGAEVSSSEVGKYKTSTYKWDGENYSYIILTFQNDKLMFKSQGGLK